MMKKNNPIQVILNSEQYKSIPEKNNIGSNTDFYADRDDAFVRHKKNLLNEIEYVRSQLHQSGSRIGLVKIELNPQALAKSHRPVNSLFPSDRSPIVGALGIGELLIQVTDKTLVHSYGKILGTEETTRKVFDKTKEQLVAKPSVAKSETGAIDRISFYGNEQKLSFTQEDLAAWQADEDESFAGYQVELVNYKTVDSRIETITPHNLRAMHRDLTEKLQILGSGIYITKMTKQENQSNMVMVQLLKPERRDFTVSFDKRLENAFSPDEVDLNPERHRLLLLILSASPLVKRITLPPKISRAHPSHSPISQTFELPVRNPDQEYPRVGVIDGGIHNPSLSNWCVSVANGFEPDDCDPDHGSQIASLLVSGNALNPGLDNIDDDGCLLYDIWIPVHHSKSNTFTTHFQDPGEFFDWLEMEIAEAVKNGFRIFNFSLNYKEFVRDDFYSFAATQIDFISKKHNVLFVISSGNLRPLDFRRSWSKATATANTPVIMSDIDRLFQPAESVSAITVGAINPPGCPLNTQGAPTVYTRRGPGVAMGVKPDVIHYGGFANRTGKTGLVSIDGSGELVEQAGTSFSAPLVSKILASLDQRTYGKLSRNSLVAMLVHHSSYTTPLNSKKVGSSLARRFAGFGMPPASRDMLNTDDSSITLVLTDNLRKSEVLEFDFNWPRSLTTPEGKCLGKATLTLVYDPVINQDYGAEYCRVNVDAVLQQQKFDSAKQDWVYRKNCASVWEDRLGKEINYEKSQIEHGLKWWPVKKYVRNSPRGVGESDQWRLKISSIERSPGTFPEEGISFTVILTIEDTQGKTNDLFNEVRQELNAIGVSFEDIAITQQVNIRSGQ
ncbi:S8 family peptidase [Dickeya fangzhongdai]|uniref:S8 family peptidase n=1 Tax=Dickeya fangzhongdai TaxID=1778540 RepID=UPI0003A67B88|nr:S8 family peptidase [Dickeya fangzhongdai]UMB77401.1 S8 family peptidase [Dickeya fangzhongdai]